jgi:RNA polymerase sigma-70 factor (ECF subfamily)
MPADLNDPQHTVGFVRLFTESARRIYAYILVLLPDEDAANDVFQEVSVTLWERFDQFQAGTDFYAWAKQIAYYKVLHYREHKRREVIFLGDAVLEQLAAETDELTGTLANRHRALADCYGKLSPQDRDLIERRYAPKAKTESVADDLGRSHHQIYRALRRIHQALYECISRALAQENG